MKEWIKGTGSACLLVLLAGCATVNPRADFETLADELATQDQTMVWLRGDSLDQVLESRIDSMLSAPLSLQAAEQIALLRNARMQATYERLGVAGADLVQAGLLGNPVFDAKILFREEFTLPDLDYDVVIDFMDIFLLSLKKGRAEAAYGQARQEVMQEVLSLSGNVDLAYRGVQAAWQRVDMFRQIVSASAASAEASRRLRDAGNIRALDQVAEEAAYQEVRMGLEMAERDYLLAREKLNSLMGVWGEETSWTIEDRLPPIPEMRIPLDSLEQQTIASSMSLRAAFFELEVLAKEHRLNVITSILPSLPMGVAIEREREEDDWHTGPMVSIPLPLFDSGRAMREASAARLRSQEAAFYADAVELRSAVRQAAFVLDSSRRIATHYRDVVLPLRARVSRSMQEQYNAMQTGVIDLLRVRQQEINVGNQYVDALRDYWQAHTRVSYLLKGVLLGANAVEEVSITDMSSPEPDSGVH